MTLKNGGQMSKYGTIRENFCLLGYICGKYSQKNNYHAVAIKLSFSLYNLFIFKVVELAPENTLIVCSYLTYSIQEHSARSKSMSSVVVIMTLYSGYFDTISTDFQNIHPMELTNEASNHPVFIF